MPPSSAAMSPLWPTFARFVIRETRLTEATFTAKYNDLLFTFAPSQEYARNKENIIRLYRIDKDTTKSKTKQGMMEVAAKRFFQAEAFAVVGASSDPKKFGHKSMSTPSLL